jgi:hypothetical protein
MDPKERCETFAHELMHAIGYEYGIEIDHDLIYRMEAALARLLCDISFFSAPAQCQRKGRESSQKQRIQGQGRTSRKEKA